MITNADIDKMKKVFATKDDLKTELSKQLKPINKKLSQFIKLFDKQLNWHHRRLNQLEEITKVDPPEYMPLSPLKN